MLRHENRDECQEEHEHSTHDWQNDGHQRNNGLNAILWSVGMVGVVRCGHGFTYKCQDGAILQESGVRGPSR